MDKVKINKNDDLFKESQKLSSRVGGLGAMVEKNRVISLKEAQDYFKRCQDVLIDLDKWCTETANFIDGCNAEKFDDADSKNLKKAQKTYNLK